MKRCNDQPLGRVKKRARELEISDSGSKEEICDRIEDALLEHEFTTHDRHNVEQMKEERFTLTDIEAAAVFRDTMIKQTSPLKDMLNDPKIMESATKLTTNTTEDLEKAKSATEKLTGVTSWFSGWSLWSPLQKMGKLLTYVTEYLLSGLFKSAWFVLVIPAIAAGAGMLACQVLKRGLRTALEGGPDILYNSSFKMVQNTETRDIFTITVALVLSPLRTFLSILPFPQFLSELLVRGFDWIVWALSFQFSTQFTGYVMTLLFKHYGIKKSLGHIQYPVGMALFSKYFSLQSCFSASELSKFPRVAPASAFLGGSTMPTYQATERGLWG